jgi:hypothetical protein
LEVSAPYPNPVHTGAVVQVNLSSDCPKNVHVVVVSVAYRKLADFRVLVSGQTKTGWDLRDLKGKDVAGGVYYMILQADGEPRILRKLLILR